MRFFTLVQLLHYYALRSPHIDAVSTIRVITKQENVTIFTMTPPPFKKKKRKKETQTHESNLRCFTRVFPSVEHLCHYLHPLLRAHAELLQPPPLLAGCLFSILSAANSIFDKRK